jgi:hypothetical protein
LSSCSRIQCACQSVYSNVNGIFYFFYSILANCNRNSVGLLYILIFSVVAPFGLEKPKILP